MNLQAFMLADDEKNKVVEKVIKGRYKAPFKMKAITPKRDAELKKECVKTKIGVKGKQESTFDAAKYQNLLIMESLVEPDLNNAELQNYYGVMGKEQLFEAMFNLGETTELALLAQEANGFEQDFDDLVEQAKN